MGPLTAARRESRLLRGPTLRASPRHRLRRRCAAQRCSG